MQLLLPVALPGLVLILLGMGLAVRHARLATLVERMTKGGRRRSRRSVKILGIAILAIAASTVVVGLKTLMYDAWVPEGDGGPVIKLKAGESAQLNTIVTFDPQPWPWHASDLVLSTVAQIIPVLLIAVGGLALFARREDAYKKTAFWTVTVTAVGLIVVEGVVLYQMGLTEGLRLPMGWIFVLAFVIPMACSITLLRVALWPRRDRTILPHRSKGRVSHRRGNALRATRDAHRNRRYSVGSMRRRQVRDVFVVDAADTSFKQSRHRTRSALGKPALRIIRSMLDCIGNLKARNKADGTCG